MEIAGCPCYLCADRDPGRDVGIVTTVREHGWCALRIVGGGPEYVYTLGMWHTYRRPEIVMFGLNGEDMQSWVNACVRLFADTGWPADEEPFTGVIDGHSTQLRTVDESWRDPLFGSAHRFYRLWPVPVRQLVWPDRDGRWPWDPEATQTCRTRQASAWLPVSEHPDGGWKLVGELAVDFPFQCGPDSNALTTQRVLDGRGDVARVVFDEDCYDVLDERGYDADDLRVAYLGDLLKRHPHLERFAGVPQGHAVLADGSTFPLSESDRAESERAWKTTRSQS
jgi:hypothetical protein